MEEDSTEPSRAEPAATCLWCGAERPVDVDVCPTCEHAWIDATIDEARGGRLEALERPPEPPPRRRWWRRRWLPLALAALAALVYGIVFWVMWDGTQPAAVAAPTTVPGLTATLAPSTAPDPTIASSTTTTTTSTTTTTTTTTTTLAPIPEVLPAFNSADLTLGAFALGSLRFGNPNDASAGRLVATFGQPNDRFPVGENWGLCPTDIGRALRWGRFSVILREEPGGEVLAGYRHVTGAGLDGESPAADELRTISGLGLGDTLQTLQGLYSTFATDTLDDGTPIYLVLRSSDRRTLLWGELSADDEPSVLSINSPRPCDGGPFAP